MDFFFTPKFVGERFKGSLPLGMLEDLSAYEDLLIEVAKHLYLSEHRKKRVPNGFNDGIALELSSLEPGSTLSKIVLAAGVASMHLGAQYLEKARDHISNVVELASSGQSVKNELPDDLLKKFNRIGKNLGDGESIEFTPLSVKKSILNKNTRKVIILSSGEKYFTEKISFRARVTAYDKLSKECTIRVGDSILKFKPDVSYIKLILDAYDGYEGGGNKILVKAEVSKDNTDKINSISFVESIDRLDPLDVPSRIDELKQIENGWLNGDGLAMNKEGLLWFGKSFEDHFSSELPLPYIFPMVDGGIQLEWNNENYSAALEFNLVKKTGEYYCISKKTKEISEIDLDFTNSENWGKLNEFIQEII